jgi:hypothetical protein
MSENDPPNDPPKKTPKALLRRSPPPQEITHPLSADLISPSVARFFNPTPIGRALERAGYDIEEETETLVQGIRESSTVGDWSTFAKLQKSLRTVLKDSIQAAGGFDKTEGEYNRTNPNSGESMTIRKQTTRLMDLLSRENAQELTHDLQHPDDPHERPQLPDYAALAGSLETSDSPLPQDRAVRESFPTPGDHSEFER